MYQFFNYDNLLAVNANPEVYNNYQLLAESDYEDALCGYFYHNWFE